MRQKLKSLGSDTLIYGSFTVIGRFLSFLLYPLYSNFIPKSEIGEIANIFAIIAFVNIIYSFGMESSFFRFYAANDDSQNKKVFTHSIITITLVSGVLSFFVFSRADYFSIILTNGSFNPDIIRLAALIPFFDALIIIPYAKLRMERRAKSFAMTRLTLILIAVIMNLILVVVFNYGTLGIFLSNIIASICGVLIFSRDIIKNLYFKFNKSLFKEMLRFGIPTIPASVSAIVLQVADKPIMRAIGGAEQLGLYTVNYKLGIVMMMLVSVFEYAWKPFYLSNYKEKDSDNLFARVLTYFTIMAAILFLSVTLFIEYIVQIPFIGGTLINSIYWQGLGIVPIILAAYYFNGVFNNFAAGIHIVKKTEYLPIAVGAAALINIILNILLIPAYGIWGAAWATFIAYAVSASIIWYFSNKFYRIKYEYKRLLIIYMAIIIILIANNLLAGFGVDSIKFLIKFLLFLMFFGFLFLFHFFKNEELSGLKNLFKSKN